jgi:hypothetical protein
VEWADRSHPDRSVRAEAQRDFFGGGKLGSGAVSRKVRRRKKNGGETSPSKPDWAFRQSIFVFLFMLVFMFIWRVVQKGDAFAWSDIVFVLLFALAMATVDLFRRRRAAV